MNSSNLQKLMEECLNIILNANIENEEVIFYKWISFSHLIVHKLMGRSFQIVSLLFASWIYKVFSNKANNWFTKFKITLSLEKNWFQNVFSYCWCKGGRGFQIRTSNI